MKKLHQKQKLIIALILNIIIVIFEIIGSMVYLSNNGILKAFRYYTQNSNYFALITSLIFCVSAAIALIKNTNVSKIIYTLRFMATACLTVTFIVVLFVLIPILPTGAFSYLMFQQSGLYHHTLCPVLSVISLLFFENHIKLNKTTIVYALIPTTIYGITCITLNILKIMSGPYPFFYVYMFPWYLSVAYNVGIFTGALLIAYILLIVYNRSFKKRKVKSFI